MLSNPLHRFSPYHNIPTTPLLSNTHVPTSHMHNAGMDALTQSSHYALQQLQQHVGVHGQHGNPHLARPGQHHMQHPHQHMQHNQAKHRQGPYGARSSSAAGPIRRRISRACDQCNQLRTKCDGQHPCAHCIEFGLGCEYIRERKKRGKASRKDLAQQAAAQAAAAQGGSSHSGDGGDDDQNDSKSSILVGSNGGRSSTADGSQNGGNVSDNEKMMNELVEDAMQRSQRTGSMDSLGDMTGDMTSVHQHQQHQQHQQQQQQQQQQQHQQFLDHHLDASAGIDLNGYAAAAAVMHNPYERQPSHQMMDGAPHTPYGQSSYPDLPYGSLQAHSPTGYSSNGGGFRLAASPMTAYHTITGAGEPASPPWMSSPPPQQQQQQLPAPQLQQEQAQRTQYHNPQNMSAAAAAAAAAAHMNSFNGMAMHNLHPSMHPALTAVGASSLSPTTAAAPSSTASTAMPSSYNPAQLRYPVLEPIIPHLATIIPLSLACDLIDLYFSSSSSAQMHPMSPYVLGFVFRKRSFLHPTKPRTCQPALLASMLWVAAQTSDAPFIASVPAARGKICQKLLELTVSLLKPLIHTLPAPSSPPQNAGEDQQPEQQHPQSPVFDGVTGLGGLGMMSDSISMEAALAQAAAAAAVEDANISSAPSGDGVNPGGINPMGGSSAGSNRGAFGAAGTVDDVVTYMHLATVVSASEYKGASLRWWNAAWCLARELKLGREVHAHGSGIRQSQELVEGDGLVDGLDLDSDKGVQMSEEEREERRRIWWLVYMVDRHLALCYNRPLFLLDLECDDLMRPMDDTAWQNGDFIDGNAEAEQSDTVIGDENGNVNLDTAANVTAAFDSILRSGPSYECSGHNIFGYFLPLMTILGEIVDLHHARNHPRFGLGCGFRSSQEWDAQISEITHHLAIYEQSLKAFEQRTLSPAALIASNEVSAAAAAAAAAATTDASNHVAMGADGHSQNQSQSQSQNQSRAASAPHDVGTPSHSVHSVHSVHSMPAMPMPTMSAMPTMPALPTMPTMPTMPAMPARMTELDIQTRIVTAYGTHVMHVLHILLAGKWDPVNLLDDNDLWISSQGFITATGHAVSAAEAISEILDYDPGLEFMPFFFGIYLLQGSFLLLLIADKLQLEASNSVVRACETIIRAHEACVVTLNTEYQRNFSRVMRSALAQARGRVPEDLGEQHMRRRELLSLYRWTGDGTGLAL